MTREVFWNIGVQQQILFYSLSVVAMAVFFFGVYRIVRIWRSSWGEQRPRDVVASARRAAIDVLLGRRIFRGDPFGGVAHFLIMWGWVLLSIGTFLLTIHHDVHGFLYGIVYLVYSLALDVAGAFFLVGISMAAFRRFALKTHQIHNLWDDPAILALLFTIAATGFLVEGLRLWSISHIGLEWSPVGDVLGATIDGSPADSQRVHGAVWWVHSMAALGLIAYIPYSKLFHMFSGPTNLYLSTAPAGVLTVEEREGLRSEFDRTEMISLDACTRCNRCEVVCPSYAAGEPLSPRGLVLSMKSYVRARYAIDRQIPGLARFHEIPARIEDAVAKDEGWWCTSCLACADRCPVGINPADIARDTRAVLMEDGRRVPRTIRDVLNNMARYGNPWEPSGPRHFGWLKELEAKDYSKGDTAGLCYYVGSLASGDERNQEVAKAMARVMRATQVDFAILGKEETDSGETARRLGEDGLFETLVEGNYATFAEFSVSNLVTTSPHAFHTMKREYPVLKDKLKLRDAPDLQVRHHTQLLAGLLQKGALRLNGRVEKRVAFHDPCYLGRHNRVFDDPRQVLKAIPGVQLVEMARTRENSFCCGGGGGRMWLESTSEHRIPELRAQDAAQAEVDVLVTACPYCMSNLTDGIKVAGYGDQIEVKDIVELVAEAL